MYPKVLHPRNEENKPLTADRNFYAGSLLKGKVEGHKHGARQVSSYFEKGKFNLDKYIEPKNYGGKQTFIGDVQFKPVSRVTHTKKASYAPYEYEPGNKIEGEKKPAPEELREKYRDAEGGHVIIKPPNMLTGPSYKPPGMK